MINVQKTPKLDEVKPSVKQTKSKLDELKPSKPKLNIVKSKAPDNAVNKQTPEQIKLAEEAAKVAAKEAAKEVARKVAVQVSKEVVNATVKKAVKKAEIIRKFPPAPDTIQKLSEPRKAAYIAVYNKHRDALKPNMVNNIRGKLAEYLEAIKEKSKENRLERVKQISKRNKRKEKAQKEYKSTEYAKYCDEHSDEIFEIFLEKCTKFSHGWEIPKPLIMGANSKKICENIQSQIINLIEPSSANDSIETIQKLSYFIMEFVKNSSVEAIALTIP